MQAKQFFALFLLVIVSVDAMIPEAQSNGFATNFQSKQVAGADSETFTESLNNIQKGLAALPIQEIGLLFAGDEEKAEEEAEEGWSLIASGLDNISA